MTHRLVALLLAWSFLLVGPAVQAQEKAPIALRHIRTVVVDPGHGGENKGALSYTGKYEKELVLQLAQRLMRRLSQHSNVKVILTRDSDRDVSYGRRIRMANEAQADLFISIHCNAAPREDASGIEVLVLSDEALAQESRRLRERDVAPRGRLAAASDEGAAAVLKDLYQFSARSDARHFGDLVQAHLVKLTRANDRGVKEHAILVLRGAEMPAIVLEVGFVSNPQEAVRLEDPEYQEKIVEGLFNAIVAFDASIPDAPVPVTPVAGK